MTNSNTLDTENTVKQCIQLINAGCDFVRISTPGIREVENLKLIKKILTQKNYYNPLIADIHFRPEVAELAARFVEKIRINPGNYTEKPTHKYTLNKDNNLETIRKKISPLISICKEYGTAIRIGVNQGSLSQRIIHLFGNTAQGMVESAMEFIEVFESLDFHNLVISLKSSNVITMIEATRLLTYNMIAKGNIYPLHLGVTEAGDEEEGITKSVAGCSSLLQYGIGDTIRISLTGDPIKEVPVATTIVNYFNKIRKLKPTKINNLNCYSYLSQPIKETNTQINNIGTPYPVILSIKKNKINETFLQEILGSFDNKNKIFKKTKATPDIICFNTKQNIESSAKNIKILNNAILKHTENKVLSFFEKTEKNKNILLQIPIQTININKPILNYLINNKLPSLAEIIIPPDIDINSFKIKTSMTLGPLLLENKVKGIIITINKFNKNTILIIEEIYNLLQVTRKKLYKPEFIACPTCSRTTYDVAGTLQKIRNRLPSSYKNIKIAVMGCIVNGPGEMADADYGYVGTSPGKVTIYAKRKIIFKNIPENEAVEKLLQLIKTNYHNINNN